MQEVVGFYSQCDRDLLHAAFTQPLRAAYGLAPVIVQPLPAAKRREDNASILYIMHACTMYCTPARGRCLSMNRPLQKRELISFWLTITMKNPIGTSDFPIYVLRLISEEWVRIAPRAAENIFLQF